MHCERNAFVTGMRWHHLFCNVFGPVSSASTFATASDPIFDLQLLLPCDTILAIVATFAVAMLPLY